MKEKQTKCLPVLRFPAFKEAWKEQRLEKFFTSSRAKGRDGMRTLSVTLNRGLINRDDIDRKTETNLEADEHLWVREGDIAYNMMRMWQGAFGRADREGIVSPAYVVLRPSASADSGYFEYAFRRNRSIYLFWAYSYGITNDRLRLYANDFLRIPFAAPTLPEQRKIAAFLTAVDGRLGQLRQKQALLEAYKQGVMQQIFTQTLRFQDDHGHAFPDWEEKTLGAVASFSKGRGISKADVHEDGALPCIRYGELYTGYAELISVVKSRTNVPAKELVLSHKNDVIIPASGETHIDIARAACVMHDGVALGGDLNIMRTKLNGVFLAYYLNNACKHAIANVAQGSSVIHLYPDQLKRLSLSLPSLPEQTKIANFLSALDGKIESVAGQIRQTQAWKQGLLQQMFV